MRNVRIVDFIVRTYTLIPHSCQQSVNLINMLVNIRYTFSSINNNVHDLITKRK